MMNSQIQQRVDISDKVALFEMLNTLTENHAPRFGMMTPQHMVEHLAYTMLIARGKGPQQHYYPAEKEQKIKEFLLGQNQEMPRGYKSPVLPVDELLPLKFSSLDEAKGFLKKEINGFEEFFRENPDARTINPTLGELNYDEWVRFHNLHFTHHFTQFGLLPERLSD